MKNKYVYSDLCSEFEKHEEYKDVKGKLLKSTIISKIKQLDEKTMSIILSFPELKNRFTKKLNDTILLDQQSLLSFFQSREFINNSFTEYTNKIGLTNGLKFLDNSDEVVLDFPYKDCVLLGNQSKEENEGVRQKFFHEVINFQEIDRLFTKKVLCNFQKHTKDGVIPVTEFKDTDNLVIKGNNLIALHTIKEKFAGKVKLIYIDPPYNTESLKFAYNDKFDQATWLTFMKNRLDIAKNLLREDGVIFVQINDNQAYYLKLLMDSIFGEENYQTTFYIKVRHDDPILREDIPYQLVIEQVFCYSKSSAYKSNRREKTKNADLDYEYDIEIKGSYKEKAIINGYEVEIYDKNSWKLIKKEPGEGQLKQYQIRGSLITQSGSASEYYELNLRGRKENDGLGALYKVIGMGERGDGLGYRYIMQPFKDDSKNGFYFQGKPIVSKLNTGLPFSNFYDFVKEFNNSSEEGNVKLANGKKPEEFIKFIFNLANLNKEDIVLDYHLGSGTTCAVAHKLGYQYIGIEQLDYGQNDSIKRLDNIINGDSTGISKSVNWQGGGEFISMNLFSLVEDILNKIKHAQSQSEIDDSVTLLLSEKYFYYLGINENKTPYEEIFVSDEFKKLSIDNQKQILRASIDKNNLYIDLNDLHDATVNLSKEEKELNEKFYKDNK